MIKKKSKQINRETLKLSHNPGFIMTKQTLFLSTYGLRMREVAVAKSLQEKITHIVLGKVHCHDTL